MAIVQGQVLSTWKGGFWLHRTSIGPAAYVTRSKYNILHRYFRSKWNRSVVKYAQEGDENAYAGQGDLLARSGPGVSGRPPDEIDRLIGRIALYIRWVCYRFLSVVRESLRSYVVSISC